MLKPRITIASACFAARQARKAPSVAHDCHLLIEQPVQPSAMSRRERYTRALATYRRLGRRPQARSLQFPRFAVWTIARHAVPLADAVRARPL
jgi:hypothetical protein